MDLVRRILYGAFAGTGATLVLTGLRKTLARAGVVETTAPEQVVARLEELGLLGDPLPRSRRALILVAHFVYGIGVGTTLGFLRRECDGAPTEAAIGSALGILCWGAGWASWLPLAGVHLPPWKQRTPNVLLPILDHAVYGAAWGLLYRAFRRP